MEKSKVPGHDFAYSSLNSLLGWYQQVWFLEVSATALNT
jgi:hypothetical protein